MRQHMLSCFLTQQVTFKTKKESDCFVLKRSRMHVVADYSYVLQITSFFFKGVGS